MPPTGVAGGRGAGMTHDEIVAGVESQGQPYVAANHWPRGWNRQAVASTASFALRLLTGFPPRSFLRLDCR